MLYNPGWKTPVVTKAAHELKIKQWEYDALIAVRDFLREKKPPLVSYLNEDADLPMFPIRRQRVLFNMSASCQGYDCGTALCIGGAMTLYRAKGSLDEHMRVSRGIATDAANYVSYGKSVPLDPLFYPDAMGVTGKIWRAITPTQGADAIDRFLAGAADPWK